MYSAIDSTDQSTKDLARSPEIIAILDQVVQKWGLQDSDAAGLLGVSLAEWQQLKSNAAQLRSGKPTTDDNPQSLSVAQLERIGILVHMLMTLHSMCDEEIADNWAGSPNNNPIFGGATPVAAMIAGGLPKMREARDYLDETATFW